MDEKGNVLYEAGNNPLESSSYVAWDEGLPIETIKQFCEVTGKEMEKELNAEFIGMEEEEDEDDN
jgi:hypothetical protein